MIKHYAYFNNQGKIIHTVWTDLENVPDFEKEFHIEVPDSFAGDLYYVNDEKNLVEKPIPPTEFHIFDYELKNWFDPRTTDSEWIVVRNKRDQLLSDCDWTQLPDVPLATKKVWAEYRQALRDITLQSNPFALLWPVKPRK